MTDKDGDGVMDHREVMQDELVLPRALAIVNEGLLIGEPPNFWLCPRVGRIDAEIDCSAKTSIGSYGDQAGSVEHRENGLVVGGATSSGK